MKNMKKKVCDSSNSDKDCGIDSKHKERHIVSWSEESQKMFGNRWTEIAKVVSCRTDNVVNNRFSVLRKKRAKCDTSSKENNGVDMNFNNKRIRKNTDRILETTMHPMKLRRKHIVATKEGCNLEFTSSENIDKTKMGEDDLCDGRKCPLQNSEFNSPLQVTPLFRLMAEGIPSPQFSES